jgi:hypothetical protein
MHPGTSPAENAVLTDLCSLEALVANNLGCRVRGFRVLQHDEGLVLCGLSSTYHGKQLAQHLVMKATRVRIFANRIEVS